MGYTHYWTQKRDFDATEWQTIRDDIGTILKYAQHEAGIPLANGHGDGGTSPEITDDKIWFNGVGDDSHETMCIDRKRVLEDWQSHEHFGWAFCKTARKPYDPVVVAVLCYLASITREDDPKTGEPIIDTESHSVTSDGDSNDFLSGLDLARKALPAKANLLDLPMALMESDRWCAPWVSNYEKCGFEVRFCVDGKGYVKNLKTKKHYQFPSHLELAKFLDRTKNVDLKRNYKVEWMRGREPENYRIEKNIWNATGCFDQARHERIAKAQRKVLATLFKPLDPNRAIDPPAYVRPGDMPANAGREFCYSVTELLKRNETEAV